MRKICEEYENPIDNGNIAFAELISPYLYNLNFTPNGITTLSFLCGLISCFFLWKKKLVWFTIFYYLSYLFDNVDGYYARRYDMVTEFGDYYDHVKDTTVNLIILYIVVKRYRMTSKTKIMTTLWLSFFTFLMLIHLGCQEKIYDHQESETLNFTRKLCFGEARKSIKVTRLFGVGTFTVVVILCIWNIGMMEMKISER